jgi:hypothetical protein
MVVAACVVAPAPGADRIHLTRVAADVTSCTAAGNVRAPLDSQGQVDYVNAERELRNQAVGLNANAIFVTSATLGVPVEGVAYRCP